MNEIEKKIVLIKRRYPELAAENTRIIEDGDQNVIVVVGECIIFRFPRNGHEKAMLLEQRLLPHLATHLSTRIPTLIYTSNQDDEIPYMGYRMIQGARLCSGEHHTMTESQKEEFARDLGRFLTELHTFPLDPVLYFQSDPALIKSNWKIRWERFCSEFVTYVFPLLESKERNRILEIFHWYLNDQENFAFDPCLLHGDLKCKHIFYHWEKSRLAGIIDFGAVLPGDPAFDFRGIYVQFGEEFAKRVFRYYQVNASPNFWNRIKYFYAKTMSSWRLIHSIRNGDTTVIKEKLEWFRYRLFDD